MDITPLIPEGRQIVEGYGGGRFRISGAVHDGSGLCPRSSEGLVILSVHIVDVYAHSVIITPDIHR